MISTSRPSSRLAARLAVLAALVLAVAMPPSPAKASPETLRRALGNIIQAPLDILLAPVVAARTLIYNLRDIDDTTAVRIVYTAPGYIWLCGLQVGAGALRGIAGGLELIPGIILLPLDTDLDPLYDPADRGAALVEFENPLAENAIVQYIPLITWNVRFGVTYTSAEY